ncbi:Inner membrane protein yehU [Fibrisoma limi BUZ 3]|uniref:Inner membrane protein yehU n=1 Tax=Fibrisoma limi BUZ 3 TaxID=1185876 RepID=I2GDU6_9BACT|nr:sensor histidine kinase [Fibrisoma limi]CCH52070.1 Inner membrane protein yehU [Fibrisoma limi BUZ 3]
MKMPQFTKQDTWIALSLLPVYYGLMNYFLFGARYIQRLDIFLLSTLVTVLIWTPIYFLHAVPAIYLRNRFPEIRHTWLRLLFALSAHILMSWATVLLFFYGYDWIGFPGYTFDATRLRWAMTVSIAGNVVANIVHESVYIFEKWTETLQETERLKKANLQSQFEGLKNQVNPHFLFNSLNTLSSLIEEDTEQAERFIEEMSSVYRYLLRSNETELTTLAAEMQFANSYFHLLRTRYGEHIQLEQAVDAQYNAYLLPPLTLQLLLENVVKHNVILPDQPLFIRIETKTTGELVVKNNLQRRRVRVLSNQVGLANIATKYELLGRGNVVVQDDSQFFTVTLPLLRPASR